VVYHEQVQLSGRSNTHRWALQRSDCAGGDAGGQLHLLPVCFQPPLLGDSGWDTWESSASASRFVVGAVCCLPTTAPSPPGWRRRRLGWAGSLASYHLEASARAASLVRRRWPRTILSAPIVAYSARRASGDYT